MGAEVVKLNRKENQHMGEPLPPAWPRRVARYTQRVQCKFKLQVPSLLDSEQLSSRLVTMVYDIRNPNRRRSGDVISTKAARRPREQDARAPQYEAITTLPNATEHRCRRFGAGPA